MLEDWKDIGESTAPTSGPSQDKIGLQVIHLNLRAHSKLALSRLTLSFGQILSWRLISPPVLFLMSIEFLSSIYRKVILFLIDLL